MNKTCSNCYQSNPPQAAFCASCAAPLSSSQSNQARQNQQYNQPNYGGWQQQQQQPAHQNFAPPANYSGEASSRAKWACALGVLGFFCLGLLGSVPAIFMGWSELNAIKSGQSPESGRGMATIGLWGGVAATVIQIGVICFFLLMAMIEMSSSPYDY